MNKTNLWNNFPYISSWFLDDDGNVSDVLSKSLYYNKAHFHIYENKAIVVYEKSKNRLYVRLVEVSSECHRQGVGRRVFNNKIIPKLKYYDEIFLQPEGPIAEAFYRSLGFEPKEPGSSFWILNRMTVFYDYQVLKNKMEQIHQLVFNAKGLKISEEEQLEIIKEVLLT